MLFPTVEFAIFFLGVFYISWALKGHLMQRKAFLLAASYFFYSFWDFRFVLLLLEASIVNYALGLWLSKPLGERKRKLLLFSGVAFNLMVLGFFKYFGFFLTSFYDLLSLTGFEREFKIWEIILPMGISFFTFQGISYVVDIYRKEIPAKNSLLDVMLYISFFPQLVAGPIVRAKDFLPQLEKEPCEDNLRVTRAFILIGIGLFKKIIIAHYVAVKIVNPAFDAPQTMSSFDLFFGMYGYAVQIYCDFSAYSDMAIGFAALLGFHFAKNFNQPYRAKNITDFWRRWHISLSLWLRDYLYIPLGGNRQNRKKTYRNLMLTMLLGGLWHGAAFTFIFWGALHGLALAFCRYLKEKSITFKLQALASIIITFHFVCLTWVFFRADSILEAFSYLKALGNFNSPAQLVTPSNTLLLVIGLFGQFVPEDSVERVEGYLKKAPLLLQGGVLGFAIVLLSSMGPGTMAPFIYFRF